MGLLSQQNIITDTEVNDVELPILAFIAFVIVALIVGFFSGSHIGRKSEKNKQIDAQKNSGNYCRRCQ